MADAGRPETLNFERLGAGEPLVLIHGVGGELCVWEPVLGALASKRDVIAVDLPGLGGSPALSQTPTPAVLAGAVARLLERLGLERADAVGNSLGAWVALELARSAHARSVVGLCPAGLWSAPLATGDGGSQGTAHRVVRRLGPVLRPLLLSRRARRIALARFAAHPDRIPDHAAWRMVRSYGRSIAYEATNTAMRQGYFDSPEEIHVPVLLAFGERDRLIRPVTIPLAGYRSVTLPGCGHIPMWDDPTLIARVILQGTGPTTESCRPR